MMPADAALSFRDIFAADAFRFDISSSSIYARRLTFSSSLFSSQIFLHNVFIVHYFRSLIFLSSSLAR